jgi:hypothetical protein
MWDIRLYELIFNNNSVLGIRFGEIDNSKKWEIKTKVHIVVIAKYEKR